MTRNFLRALFAVAFLLPTLPAVSASAGKLKKLRREVRHGPSRGRSTSSSSGDYGSGDDDGSGVVLALYALTAPWWLPYYATGDRYGRDYAFPGHPYAGGIDGYARIAGVSAAIARAVDGREILGNRTALRIRGEYGYLGSDLSRWTLAARLSTSFRLELETEWSNYLEGLRGGGLDQLWLGDLNVTMIFAQSEHVQFHSGLGLRLMVDGVPGGKQVDSGINFTWGFDWYPVRPLVFSATADPGTLGHAFVIDLRGTVGVMIGSVEVYGGYKRIDVGWSVFGGPVVGLRSWH